jgi:hypothetical protein
MSSTTRICPSPRPSPRKRGEGDQIPLLFLCSAEKFRCSADLIPLLRRVAELMRKPLFCKAFYGHITPSFRSDQGILLHFPLQTGEFRCQQGYCNAAPARR